MKKRHKMSRKSSRRSFTKGATRIKKANSVNPMRGGWRM